MKLQQELQSNALLKQQQQQQQQQQMLATVVLRLCMLSTSLAKRR
jgi:hypothetical protein